MKSDVERKKNKNHPKGGKIEYVHSILKYKKEI